MSEEDIEEMFTFADKDSDGKISYIEFQAMINPPKPPPEPQPHRAPTPTVKKVTIKTTENQPESIENVDTTETKEVEGNNKPETLVNEK